MAQLQNFYAQHGLVRIVLNLMNINNNDIFWEAMALLGVLLFQANLVVQNEVKTQFICYINICFLLCFNHTFSEELLSNILIMFVGVELLYSNDR